MTKVFISWSGEVSKEIAEELREWIPSVLQFARPYFTPNDVEKGSKWGTEISQQLAETNVGIICLTRDNFTKPWILFEAGALSKDLDNSKVCSVLFGMENSDLTGPLTTFQTTSFDQSDFRKLMLSINDSAGDRALSRDIFENVFLLWWPILEEKIGLILRKEPSLADKEVRSERDLLEEVLDLTRLAARRNARSHSDPKLPQGLVAQFLATLESLMDHYERDEGRNLFLPVSDQLEIAKFLVDVDQDSKIRFNDHYERLKERFDNIIPF